MKCIKCSKKALEGKNYCAECEVKSTMVLRNNDAHYQREIRNIEKRSYEKAPAPPAKKRDDS